MQPNNSKNDKILFPIIYPDKNQTSNQIFKRLQNETLIPISIEAHQMDASGIFKCNEYTSNFSQISNYKVHLKTKKLYNLRAKCWTTEANFSYTFKGVKFGLYGTNSNNNGKFDVEIDGHQVVEIDEMKETKQEYELIFLSDLLKYKEHTVRTIAKGDKYELYKLVYWPSLTAVRKNITSITKIKNLRNDSHIMSEIIKHSSESSTLILKAKCSKIWLYGTKSPEPSQIYITYGNFSDKVSTYSNKIEEKSLVYESESLSYAYYTINITIPSDYTFYCIYYEDPLIYNKTKILNTAQKFNPNINTNLSSNESNISNTARFIYPSDDNRFLSIPKSDNFNFISHKISTAAKTTANKVQKQLSVQDSIFRKMTVNEGIANSLYISTNDGYNLLEDSNGNYDDDYGDETELEIEVKIENNYFNLCGETDYINLIESKIALMRNNTFDFSKSSKSCGAFYIISCGNITIIDCHFINTKASGTIYYGPEYEAKEEDFLLIQDCTFTECNGVCLYLDILANSFEKVTICNCSFIKCKKGEDNSIALLTSETADSIKLTILNSVFFQCGENEDKENCYVINLHIKQPKKIESISFDNVLFNKSCNAIKINQNDASNEISDVSISNCIFNDCGNAGYVVTFYSCSLYFSNNRILFDDPKKSAKGLSVYSNGRIDIKDSVFHRCNNNNKNGDYDNDSQNGGGISIKPSNLIENNKPNKLSIVNVTFNEMDGIDYRCFCIIWWSNEIIMNDISILNSPESSCSNGILYLLGSHISNEFENWLFYNNTSNSENSVGCGNGGGCGFLINSYNNEIDSFSLTFVNCNWTQNHASCGDYEESQSSATGSGGGGGNGGGIQVGFECNVDVSFLSCVFNENGADRSGGAIALQTLAKISIINCTFDRNVANYDLNSKGKGGSIYVNQLHEADSPGSSILIENCTFRSSKGYDGLSIYLAGNDRFDTLINITKNDFIGEDENKEKGFLIFSEFCRISRDQIIKENYFAHEQVNASIFISDCKQEEPTQEPTQASDTSVDENIFDTFSQSTIETFQRITLSKSYSLTYVSRRSVSFSLSYISSFTFEMSYDPNEGTYTLVLSQIFYQDYFPYIIYYMSPFYIEQNVTIQLTKKNRITKEQLIGIVCGSVSVFFLTLGIIILTVRRKNDFKNQFSEFEDLSDSTNEVEIHQVENNNIDVNENETKVTIDDDSYDFYNFWA